MTMQTGHTSRTTPANGIPRLVIGVLIAVGLLAVALRIIPQPRTIDDAFITFRYSRNIVEGNGFVYNLGEKVLGTTTPFYTLFMAGISIVTGSDNYPQFALVTNALADGLSTILLALIGYRLTRAPVIAAAIGLLWAINPMSVAFSLGGMETSISILWLIAAHYCYLTHRDRWMAACIGVGILTRIDALVWAGPLMLHHLITYWQAHRPRKLIARLPWDVWAIVAAILIPWYLFSWSYFGVILSQSISAKRVVYHLDDLQALIRLIQHLATPFMDDDLLGVPGIAVGIVLYPALAAVGTLFAVRRQPRLLPFLLYPWIYTIVFSVMNPLIFRWYLAPILPAYIVAIILGVWALVDASAGPRRTLIRNGIPLAAAAWFAILALNAWTLHPDHGPDRPAPQMAWHQIELYYQRMGEMLRKDYGSTAETVVAAGDIGALGYYSKATILDTVGLISPEVMDYYPYPDDLVASDANYAVPPAVIYDFRPDYIVIMEVHIRNGLLKQERFADEYQLIALIPTDFYGTGMHAYQRRD